MSSPASALNPSLRRKRCASKRPPQTAAIATFLVLIFSHSSFAQGTYEASVEIDASRTIGPIQPEIYGQYLEHVEEADECIYPSIWDNTSPLSDAKGLRTDVISAARQMNVPVVRWPGGCFADVHHWENGIGPRADRPILPNKHWGGNESHQFGTDEFLQWSAQVGNKPYINVNLGSGTLDEALHWLEYCNGEPTTSQGKRRAQNGHAEPYKVPFWGIGNETWGEWETGHMDAATYATTLATWASAMKEQDPSIKLLAVGSNEGRDPEWDREVLEKAGELIDYLTLHIYGSSTNDDPDGYDAVVFTPDYFDFRIRAMVKTIDDFKKKNGLNKDIAISIDEWNIRHFERSEGDFLKNLRRRDPRNVEDMMFVAGTLNVMLRHSPRVAMANYVFLVNGHAPLLVDEKSVVKTPLFYIFQQYAEWMKGTAIAVETKSPAKTPPPPRTGGMSHPEYPADYGPKELPLLDAAGARHNDGTIVLSLANRHRNQSAVVDLRFSEGYELVRSWTLGHENHKAVNDFTDSANVVPHETSVEHRISTWTCAPHSVVLLYLKKKSE